MILQITYVEKQFLESFSFVDLRNLIKSQTRHKKRIFPLLVDESFHKFIGFILGLCCEESILSHAQYSGDCKVYRPVSDLKKDFFLIRV